MCCGKSSCDHHIKGACNPHQASEDETGAGDTLAQWQISLDVPSDLWDFA